MRDLLHFDTMLTPKIVTIIYWLLLAGVVLSGLGTMFSSGAGHMYGPGSGLTFASLFMGLLVIVFGAIGARIWCELLIVIFKIHESLKKMADQA
ncbi:MAG: DUF4282 domain-containing protein [Pseudomonadota bacterium]